jgi:hypothetical protein
MMGEGAFVFVELGSEQNLALCGFAGVSDYRLRA